MTNISLASFGNYFNIVPAFSDRLKNEVYRLRYQAFCIENETFNAKDYPDGREVDQHDPRSAHYLIQYLRTGRYVATTRLILPDHENLDRLFPLEEHSEIDEPGIVQSLDRRNVGEISRFCISKTFKNEIEGDGFSAEERRLFHYISVVLMACVLRAAYDSGVQHIYVTSEPAWFRFVAALGISYVKIGPLAENHGKRYPAVINIADMLTSVAIKNPEVYLLFTGKTIKIPSHKVCVSIPNAA